MPITQTRPDVKQQENLDQFCQHGLAVIETELQAIEKLRDRIDAQFAKACTYLLQCRGRIVVIGMGKSGHIAGKIAATLASTGSPAFFVHPSEASHGDMGMITNKDVALALSNSGETREILTLLPIIEKLKVPLISLTGNTNSTLAKASSVNLNINVDKEACPLNLAPTASTTASLVIGDALAIALLQARSFTCEDFAFSHPGGNLGKRLLLRVDDLMHTGDRIPKTHQQASLSQALMEMTQKALGMTTVIDAEDKLVGIYTDGDLRRTLDKNLDIKRTQINQVMTVNYKKIPLGTLAVEALEIMKSHKITSLVVADESNHVKGIIHMHDVLRAGL